ncbi:hypothetical protein OH782_40950 [Streptomyces sp. NBC_01544]|uniref:hypothetical protein n=1 Tax=Streptomyces sp. NBC_01544 TaxID=2975871 RepID=UPI00386A9CA4
MLTNAVRYADPAQHRIADALDASRRLRPINRHRVDRGERWLNGQVSGLARSGEER